MKARSQSRSLQPVYYNLMSLVISVLPAFTNLALVYMKVARQGNNQKLLLVSKQTHGHMAVIQYCKHV